MLLVHRTTRCDRSTEAGLALKVRRMEILPHIADAIDYVSGFNSRAPGQLKIRFRIAFASFVLSRILPALLGDYPESMYHQN